MRKVFAGLLVVTLSVLFGCGGGGSGGTAADSTVKKTAVVTGTVSFPSLSSLVAKQVAVAPGTIIPPVLTITDLSGAVIATPTLTVDPANAKKFTYAVNLDAINNYIFKASWGGQVLRVLADKSTLSTLTSVINITPISTAAVLVAEKNLNLTLGQLGTTAASAISDAQVSVLNPAGLLTAVGAPTYTTLVATVTSALTGLTDPAAVAAVTTAVSTAPAYTLTSITVTPAIPSVAVVATQQFTATGTYSDASTKDLTGAVVWSSSNISAATIAISGIATTVAAGTTTITATSGSFTGTASLTATAPVTTTPSGFTAAAITGNTYLFDFTLNSYGVYPATATFNANGTGRYNAYASTWRIDQKGVLTILVPTTGLDMEVAITSGSVGTIAYVTVIEMQPASATTQAISMKIIGTMAPKKTAPPAFTAAMLAGHTFNGSGTDGYSGTGTYNANGTFTGTNLGTWSINASGQLVLKVSGSGNVATFTLTGVNGNVYTASESVSNGNKATYTFTDVTPAATNLSGIWYGTIVQVNADGSAMPGAETQNINTTSLGGDVVSGYSGIISGDFYLNARLKITPLSGTWYFSIGGTGDRFGTLITAPIFTGLNPPTQAAVTSSLASNPSTPSALQSVRLESDITTTGKYYYSMSLHR